MNVANLSCQYTGIHLVFYPMLNFIFLADISQYLTWPIQRLLALPSQLNRYRLYLKSVKSFATFLCTTAHLRILDNNLPYLNQRGQKQHHHHNLDHLDRQICQFIL